MDKNINYCQCHLRKKRGNNYINMISWIPQKYAIQGKFLKLKNKDGEWEDHWEVTGIGATEKEKKVIQDERGCLKQREKSDI